MFANSSRRRSKSGRKRHKLCHVSSHAEFLSAAAPGAAIDPPSKVVQHKSTRINRELPVRSDHSKYAGNAAIDECRSSWPPCLASSARARASASHGGSGARRWRQGAVGGRPRYGRRRERRGRRWRGRAAPGGAETKRGRRADARGERRERETESESESEGKEKRERADERGMLGASGGRLSLDIGCRGRPWPPRSVIGRVFARKWALEALIWTEFHLFGSGFSCESDNRGPDPIRKIGLGPQRLPPCPTSKPKTREVVRIRALGAHVRADIRPNKLRAGARGRPPALDILERSPRANPPAHKQDECKDNEGTKD